MRAWCSIWRSAPADEEAPDIALVPCFFSAVRIVPFGMKNGACTQCLVVGGAGSLSMAGNPALVKPPWPFHLFEATATRIGSGTNGAAEMTTSYNSPNHTVIMQVPIFHRMFHTRQ